jgi:hypothetical protein
MPIQTPQINSAVPDGYRRPLGCTIDDAPASRSIEFATALAVELHDTDDDAEIAKLAHEIDRHPNAFVLRVHRLEKRLAAIEARMRQECECGEDATTRVLVTAPRSGCVEFDADVCDDCATGARRRYDEQGYDVAVTPIGAGAAK